MRESWKMFWGYWKILEKSWKFFLTKVREPCKQIEPDQNSIRFAYRVDSKLLFPALERSR